MFLPILDMSKKLFGPFITNWTTQNHFGPIEGQGISNYMPILSFIFFFLTAHQSNRVCNALALLQCVASHPETRSAFLLAHIPLYLYPFLHTVSKTRPFEYLRLTSLGVIGKLICDQLKRVSITV